jgi:hypothetical protein
MNNTLLIILAAALVVAGVVGWLILSPGDGAPEVEEPTEHVFVEPVPLEPVPLEPEVEPEPAREESAVVPSPLWAVDGVIDLGEYTRSTTVSDVSIHWSNDTNMLRIGLESPGTGYVSIGFDPVRRMEGANIIIGYVREGEAFVRDDFGTGPTDHAADTDRGGQDNVLSYAGTEWADHTVFEFVIPLDSGDEMDKPLRPGETYEILVAYHDLQDGFSATHSRRGAGEIQLTSVP